MIGSMYTLYFGYNPYSPYCSRSFMKWLPMRDAVSCNCTTDEMQQKISSIFADIWKGSYIQECLPAAITAVTLPHTAVLIVPYIIPLLVLYITALTLLHTTALILPYIIPLIVPHTTALILLYVSYPSISAAHYSSNTAAHYSSNTAIYYPSDSATHYSSNTAAQYSSNTNVCKLSLY